MQELYLLDDCFFGAPDRTSLFYCPIACHSLIQPVGLRMREGEPGCVDLGLGCREHMEVDWIGMKWDSFPCRKPTRSEMEVSWHRYPKLFSRGWQWLRNSHGDLGMPHDLRTPSRVAKDSCKVVPPSNKLVHSLHKLQIWPSESLEIEVIHVVTRRQKPNKWDFSQRARRGSGDSSRQSAEIDPFHSYKVTGQDKPI